MKFLLRFFNKQLSHFRFFCSFTFFTFGKTIWPMQFTAVLSKFDSPLWGYHILVPDEVSKHFLSNGHKRVICTLNSTETFHCAFMPSGEGTYFISVNKELRQRLKLRIGSIVTANIQKDESKYGLPMPEELEELLAQDPIGDGLFHDLTPGKQRSMIYIAGKPKLADTRLRKAVVLIEHLKANQGKIDYKRLQDDMKAANKI